MLFHDVSSGGSETASEVVGIVRKEAPILEHVHFFVEPGGTASLRKDSSIESASGFRALNNDYAAKDQGDPAFAAFSLRIFGKTLKVDRALERRGSVRGGSEVIASELSRQRRAFARNLGRNLNRYMITGSSAVSALQFNGLLKAVDGLADSQTLDALGENGTQILTGNTDAAKKSQQKFVEALGFLIAAVAGGASALLMNSKLIARLSTVARDNVSTTTDEFGRPIKTFDGVPIIPVGYDYDGTELLPFSGTVGTSTDCSTVCALRSEEAAYWSFMTTPGGLWVSDVQMVGNFYEQTVELQLDSGEPFNARSLAVLPGVRLG